MKRAARVVGVSLAVALAALLVGIALLLATQVGARLSLGALARLASGLAVERVTGTWATRIVIEGLHYENGTLVANVRRVALQPALLELVRGRIAVRSLEVDGARVALPETERAAPSAAPYPAPVLPPLPAFVAIDSVVLSDVVVTGAPVELSRLRGSLVGPAIKIAELTARVAGYDVAASAQLDATDGVTGMLMARVTLPATSPTAQRREVALDGDVALVTAAEPWYARLDWRTLTWRTGGDQVTSTGGHVVARLGAAPAEVELEADVDGAPLPHAAHVEAAASFVTPSAIELQRATIDALGGTLTAHGHVAPDTSSAELAIEVAGLDPGAVDERLRGRLDGHFDLRVGAQPALRAALTGTANGTLGDAPLAATIDATYADGGIDIERGRVTLADSRVDAHGTWSPQGADLDLEASIPEAGRWYPSLAGEVHATARVQGDGRNPTLDVALRAHGLAVAGVSVDELTAAARGTLAEHTLNVDAHTAYGTLGLHAAQGLRDGQLRGRLLTSELDLPQGAGVFELTSPAAFTLGTARQRVEAACYRGPGRAELCLDVDRPRVAVHGAALPVALASPWLPAEVAADGAVDLDARLDWSNAPTGALTLTAPAIVLRARADAEAAGTAGALRRAEIADVSLEATLTSSALTTRLAAGLPGAGGHLDGTLTLAPAAAHGTLQGRIDVEAPDLTAVDAAVGAVEGLEGTLHAALEIAGTPAVPDVHGSVKIDALRARVPRLDIEVTDGRLDAQTLDADAARFTGQLCSGGCLTFEGRIQAAAPWRLTAQLRGSDFSVANRDDLRARVAPTLDLEGGAEQWLVTGDLGIADGRLILDEVPRSAIRPAPETVVHGRVDSPADDRRDVLPVAIRVRTQIDAAHFEGLGIVATVGGDVEVEQPTGGPLRVQGTLDVSDGTFTAYGQKLMLEPGQLIFSGAPDNPGLDLRATRQVEDTTVGLTLMGTARDVRSEVFSDPPLQESEALARLLTGHSLASAGATDSAALERAAIGLGIKRALPALDQLGGNLGLELGVTSDGGNGGALVAGKQLGDDVYLRYKHGLFDDFAGLELIYRITEHLRLRTETGSAQSIDLVYHVGRGAKVGGGAASDPTGVAAPPGEAGSRGGG